MTAPSAEIIRQVRADPLALSVRQPWAWAIVAGMKPLENRGASVAGQLRKLVGQRIAIHAAYNMSDPEYAQACAFMRGFGIKVPPIAELWYGGVIGSARLGAVVGASASPWFSGPFAVELIEPRAVDFIAYRGMPGVFKIAEADLAKADRAALAAARA